MDIREISFLAGHHLIVFMTLASNQHNVIGLHLPNGTHNGACPIQLDSRSRLVLIAALLVYGHCPFINCLGNEIGRASCRERVYRWGDGGEVGEEKKGEAAEMGDATHRERARR